MLYTPLEGGELLTQAADAVVVGLRRRLAPQGLEPRVELLVLGPADARAVLKELANVGVEVYVVYALSLLHETNWVLAWLLSAEGPAHRMYVLIDDDPIELITRHGVRGADLHLTYLKARSDPACDEHTEILCFAAGDEPDVIYFTPCSTPFRQSVTEYAGRRFAKACFDGDFVKRWLPMFQRLIVHTLREEARFGDRFWI